MTTYTEMVEGKVYWVPWATNDSMPWRIMVRIGDHVRAISWLDYRNPSKCFRHGWYASGERDFWYHYLVQESKWTLNQFEVAWMVASPPSY